MSREEFARQALGHLEEVTAYARRLTRSEADADDLVQSAYAAAFSAWRALRDAGACRAWLFRIARNLHFDRMRAVRARPELRLVDPRDSVAPEPTLSPETVERLEARVLEIALGAVPEAQREAVLLSDLWGFAYAEIAQILEVPVGTVRSRIARGRAALLERLALLEAPREGRGGRR